MSTSPAGPRTCAREGCGNIFTPKRSDARYCSDSCRNTANRAHSRSDPTRSDRITAPIGSGNRPDRIAAVPAITPSAPLTWEPTAEPRGQWEVSEACPECGGRLHTTGRATIRVCLSCQHRVIPPGVAAPYQRGGPAARQVKSQRERDLEAIELAKRKGIMLAELAALAADKQLHSESVPVVEWFAAEVRAARSDDRLTELAERFREAGIRRRRWWQSTPAVETADYGEDDEDDEPGYDEDNPDYGEEEGSSRANAAKSAGKVSRVTGQATMAELSARQLAPAPISKPPLPDYSTELAVREWIIRPHGPGLCNLIHMRPHGWDGIPPEECINRAKYLIAGAAVCESCFYALNQPHGGMT